MTQNSLQIEAFVDLETALGHRFNDAALLKQALTHSSACKKRLKRSSVVRGKSYERLEFLGDRVLGLTVARMLYDHFPNEPEGHLAKRLSLLVSKPTLAQVARELEIQHYMMVSSVERLGGGLENDGLLSDVVEAVIAALYLDAGLEAAEAFIRDHWSKRLTEDKRPPIDPKSTLQEWSQGKLQRRPDYQLVECTGPSHKPNFRVRVSVEGFGKAMGLGPSKRQAESKAAEALISELKSQGKFKKPRGS